MDRLASNIGKVVARTTASKPISFEVANLAKFSDGSCTCSLGDTTILVTAVSSKTPKPGGFVPLSVEYKQKAAAAGRIPMTHLRRDVGITEKEILTSRMIDRSIRPSFQKGFYYDTQVICNLLAVDGTNDPDVLAINGASASLAISDIPWNGPIGAVRMGLVGDALVVNPSRKEQENSRLNLIITANRLGNIIMMEGGCKEPVLIPDVNKTIKQGVKECQEIIQCISKLQQTNGKLKREIDTSSVPTDEQKSHIMSLAQVGVREVLTNHKYDKIERDEAMKVVRNEAFEKMKVNYPEITEITLSESFSHVVRVVYRSILDQTKLRCDGRSFDQSRPINCFIDLYKPLHGSALFQRGQTQVFCSATFDSPDAAFRTDYLTSIVSGIKEKNFMLHYEFPKFATNEIGRVGSMPDRREIGHGALAEKAIRPMVPENPDMTLRLNCEVLESNGSSSMASVCAGSMSLMDAGVPIKEHVAGVAMGLFGSENGEQMILTDILGFEDYVGDMDFKIAGTRKALTALQLDVKPVDGVSPTTIYQAIKDAHTARSHIINEMEKVIKKPRQQKKENHPVIKTVYIPPHQTAKFIGFGGSNLKKMMATIGVKVSSFTADENASQSQDNFIIFAPNREAMQEAEDYIQASLEKQKEPELTNGIYTATIQEIRDNGIMVTLYPNMTPALVRKDQLDIKPIIHPSALKFEVGQQIQVQYFGRDPANGQMRLSRKSLLVSASPRIQRSPVSPKIKITTKER